MQRLELLENHLFFAELDHWQRQLVSLSVTLWEREKTAGSHFSDYSFVVFPMAKAYEGFLKSYLLKNALISNTTYQSKRFRIGRALNPDLRMSSRDEEWFFDNIERMCGTEIARGIWDTWLKCRNRVFHYFPDRPNNLTLEQAGQYLDEMSEIMMKAISCQTVGPGTTMR